MRDVIMASSPHNLLVDMIPLETIRLLCQARAAKLPVNLGNKMATNAALSVKPTFLHASDSASA